MKNGDETDVDCGGSCSPCSLGESCSIWDDCTSNYCAANNTCVTPTCDDGVQNSDETDIDCGGSCSTKCGEGEGCLTGNDCVGGSCSISETCGM